MLNVFPYILEVPRKKKVDYTNFMTLMLYL